MILAFKQELSQSIADGALIITATRRLAKQWQPILVSSSVSPSPQILSQKDWLNNLWNKLEASGLTSDLYLLNDAQEIMLWKSIIESSTQGERLLRIKATAKSVARAAGLLKQWKVSLEVLEQSGMLNEETHLFLQWAYAFNQILQDRAFITQACLANKILNLLTDGYAQILTSYSSAKKIKLLGFEDIPPQFQLFYTELRLKGWEVSELKLPNSTGTGEHHKYAFYDQVAELQSAALWAKSLRAQVKYPGAIGVVVPDLAQCRELVYQIFTQVLDPLSELQAEQVVSDHFNISVAPSLASYPIVFVALKVLDLLELERLNIDDLLFLIRSPFITLFGLDMERSQYCSAIKRLKKQTLNVAELNTVVKNFSKIIYFKAHLPAKCALSHWAVLFEQFLKLIAWPGERALNSIEHQTMARWQILLEELGTLESVLEPQDLNSAIRLLHTLAHDIPFQGQSKPAPIHIMGILEASSQPFEYLWVSGLHNEAWPPIPKANPFLPIVLQKKYQMPHASSEREYYFAQKLTDNLKNACDRVVFSYFKNDTVKQYQPSDLIADIQQEPFFLTHSESVAEQLFNISHKTDRLLESIVDSHAPIIQDSEYVQGGTSLIEAQATCPFKAFAQYRLHALPKDKLTIGLHASERGTLVHKILEQIWSTLKTHDGLCALTEAELEVFINKIINYQIQNVSWKVPELPAGFWEVELWRLNIMIKSWLGLEKKRQPFSIVAQEQSATMHLAGLQFNIRLDRVDCSENGEIIILDYKTGNQNLEDNLQLSIYCIASALEVKAAVFGQLQAQSCQFVGLSESEMLPGVKAQANWNQLLSQWKESLETLVLEFKDGQAKVHPHKGDQSCRTCHLLQVCRLKSLENE